MSLPTLSEFKTYLWISWSDQDTLLTLLLESAKDFANNYTNRKLEEDTYTNELYNGDGQRELILKQYPVTTLTSFEYNEWDYETSNFQPVEVSEYKLDWEIGNIFLNFRKYRSAQNYRVTYTAGYSDVNYPNDLKLAIYKIAWSDYNTRTSQGIKKRLLIVIVLSSFEQVETMQQRQWLF